MTDLELKIKIIEVFLEDEELVYYYKYFERKTGEDKRKIKKIMDELRRNGMVELVRGLFDADGDFAGSGFALTNRAMDWSIREWLSELKKIQVEEVN